MIKEIKVVAKANGINVIITNSTERIEAQLNRLTRDEDLPIMLISWDITTNIAFDNNGMLKNPLSNITALLLSKPEDLTKVESEDTAEEMASLFRIFIQDLRAFLIPYQKTIDIPITNCSYQLVPSKGMGKHSGVLAKWTMATSTKHECIIDEDKIIPENTLLYEAELGKMEVKFTVKGELGTTTKWNWGDGSSSDITHTGNDITFSHTYREEGVYPMYSDEHNLQSLKYNIIGSNYINIKGSINNDDFRNLTYEAYFYGCYKLEGNISSLINLTYSANFRGCIALEGDISSLINLTYFASFVNCSLLTGDISSLINITNEANFYSCQNLTASSLFIFKIIKGDFSNCDFSTQEIENICASVDSANTNVFRLYIRETNAVANAQALIHIANIQSRGGTVYHN